MAKTAGPNGSCGVKKVKITPCAPAAFPVQYIRLRIVYKERNVLRMERIGEKAYLVLENGRIIQRGTHEELAAREGLYRRICAIQNELDEEEGVAV